LGLIRAFPEFFRQTLIRAARVAVQEKALVTVGVKALRPETGFGYIRPGIPLQAGGVPDRCPPQRLELEAARCTRTTCAGRSPGSQAASGDAGPLAFPRLGAVALRADVTCLPLRGQRRNCLTMTWGAPASRFTSTRDHCDIVGFRRRHQPGS